MARRPRRPTRPVTMPTLHPHAAGIDLGATEIYVCVPLDRDPEPIRRFGTFTEDLHALADWLTRCGVTSVSMESTGVYWIPLYQILETRHLEVCFVNALHVKHAPGRKSDVQDCQWFQYLYSVGSSAPPSARPRRSAPSAPSCGIGTAWSSWRPRTPSTCRKRSPR